METFNKEEFKKWVESVVQEDPQWAKERRVDYLKSEIERIKSRNKKIESLETEAREFPEVYFSKDFYKHIVEYLIEENKKVSKLENQIEKLEKPRYENKKITDEMIENAKNYPIENLIEVNKAKFSTCLWHNDKNPSMYCKNNFAHCFSCGKTASVIDIYMQLNNCDFKTAIKELQ